MYLNVFSYVNGMCIGLIWVCLLPSSFVSPFFLAHSVLSSICLCQLKLVMFREKSVEAVHFNNIENWIACPREFNCERESTTFLLRAQAMIAIAIMEYRYI